MYLLVTALFGSAVFNGSFFKLGIGPFNVLNVLILACALTYLAMHIHNKKRGAKYGPFNSGDIFLWCFVAIGALYVAGSYAGVFGILASTDVSFAYSYIPRQAYYLFFIPLIMLAGRHYQTKPIIVWMGKHYKLLFASVYMAYISFNGTLAIDVPCFFCLSFLLLAGRERDRVCDLVALALICLSPIDSGGEMTQLICRVLCLFLFFSRESDRYLRPLLLAAVAVALLCYLLPFIPLEGLGFDANTSWRLQYWSDELTQLADTYGIGVGYGTSYATQDFIGEAISGPFAATTEYSVAERVYVVGCHNSFVSLAYRLGVLGIFMLFAYIYCCSNRCLDGERANFLIYAVVSSVLIVCFNVGFESPVYFFLFAFSFAALGALSEKRMEIIQRSC